MQEIAVTLGLIENQESGLQALRIYLPFMKICINVYYQNQTTSQSQAQYIASRCKESFVSKDQDTLILNKTVL